MSSVIKSLAVPLHPTSIPCIHTYLLPICYTLSIVPGLWECHSTYVQVTLMLLNNAPNCKSSDPSNLTMPKRSHEVLPVSEKMKVIFLLWYIVVIFYFVISYY
jgi:hypothetical protein